MFLYAWGWKVCVSCDDRYAGVAAWSCLIQKKNYKCEYFYVNFKIIFSLDALLWCDDFTDDFGPHSVFHTCGHVAKLTYNAYT